LQLNLLPGTEGKQVNLGVALGGSGGAGGAGGEVGVNNSGRIETRGAEAAGIFAQSVSNGGGDGGLALTLNLQPGQPADVAIVNLNFAVGGAAGNGQAGGAVSVVNSGDISTGSYAAAGIYAASIGGGGGNAGDADSVVFNVACVIKCSDADKDKASKQSKSLSVNIGGRGGAGNNGGSVSVQNSANVTTVGTASYAIEATSIGAGGGDGGGSAGTPWYASGVPLVTKSRVGTFSKVAVKLGGDGGARGDGGSVTVTQSGGLLSTRGDGATAILAHRERYDVEATGLVHFTMLDVRRVMGTTDVESNAQASAPMMFGRDIHESCSIDSRYRKSIPCGLAKRITTMLSSTVGMSFAMNGFDVSTIGTRWKLMCVCANCGQM
jgi:hypothetical protein